MPTVDVERTRAADVVEQIASDRFAYPDAEHPTWQTFQNLPEEQIGVQVRGGGWIYPDIVVVEEPGHFIELVGIVALRHEVTEAVARAHWLPLSKAGPLYLYVPAGQTGRANRLCNELGIRLAGLRAWKWTRGFGFEVEEAYSGLDLGRLVAAILPPFMRPLASREERREQEAAYAAPGPAQRAALAAGAAPLLEAGVEAGELGFHTAPPSPYPILIGLGAALTAFGAVFPAELLGAGAGDGDPGDVGLAVGGHSQLQAGGRGGGGGCVSGGVSCGDAGGVPYGAAFVESYHRRGRRGADGVWGGVPQ